MMNRKAYLIVVTSILVICIASSQVTADLSQDISQKIDWLNNRLNGKFFDKNENFSFLQGKWAEKKGLYESSIHINYIDKKNKGLAAKIRKSPIGDINMFVTSFVLYAQLEAQELGTTKINDHQFGMALESLNDFRDKNTPFGVPQYMFWPQEQKNGIWFARPVNLVNMVNLMPANLPGPVNKFLEKAGLWMVEYAKQMVKVFSIPADNDDSSVNLALLGFMKETNSSHFQYWNNLNFDKKAYYERLLKYAYRPFGSHPQNPTANEIDPRTYYGIHEFIEEVQEKALETNSTPSLILPTTWLIRDNEQVQDLVMMPFGDNNVDATVCANVLLGLNFQIITGELKIEDIPELEQLIRDITDFLVFIVEKKIEIRPDLTLVYYPSKYDFYWFLSRNVHLLKRHKDLPRPLQYAKDRLEFVMKTQGTEQIFKNKKSDAKGQAFWVEFLGNYADKNRNEDAVFNTAMALNALLDTWATRNNSELTYDDDATDEVKKLIDQAANYLLGSMNDKMQEFNSFFSGSMKSYETSPYIYPANVHLLHGKNIDPQTASPDEVDYEIKYKMKGFMPKEQYEAECKKKWFQQSVPETFKGYNNLPFPFWSSKSITEAMLIAGLSKKLRVK